VVAKEKTPDPNWKKEPPLHRVGARAGGRVKTRESLAYHLRKTKQEPYHNRKFEK
jgi:hypothetical protein